MIPAVYAIATMDTKGNELAFVASCLRSAGVETRTVDVGTLSDAVVEPDVSRSAIVGDEPIAIGNDRGSAVTQMGERLRSYLQRACASGHVVGIIGIGGSGGTALITAAMRALPIGLPKFMVSTVASGNTAPYVDCSDITMMYSVVDVAGMNAVSRKVLANAAHAMAGMVSHDAPSSDVRPALGMTMFGVTTECVDGVRRLLTDQGFDCLVFHATGAGGRAMEQLVESGLIRGVLDITTTEVADEVVGGVFPAGSGRFEKTLRAEVPLVMSVGAMDMVNFGAKETVPARFKDRRLHVHNAQVTLMRTSPNENRKIAKWMADRLNKSTAPLVLMLPTKGVSMIDAPDQPFHDPIANEALFSELEARVAQTENRRIVRSPYHINDAQFAVDVVNQFNDLQEPKPSK